MVMQLIDHDFCVRQVAEERLGGIDYLVLNHIMPLPMAEWTANATNFALLHQVMNINFKAYVYLASYALPVLEKTRGSIVVMSSLAGEYNLYPPPPPPPVLEKTRGSIVVMSSLAGEYNLYPPPPCWRRPGVASWSCHPWLVSIIYTPPPPNPRAGKDPGQHRGHVIPGW